MPSRVERAFGTSRPLIGVVHLPPLPGYRGCPGMPALIAHALADLEAFEHGGLTGLLVENEHDTPHRVEAARETIAAISVIAHELVRAARSIAVGVEILLNDPEASLAAAHAAGAAFIRTDYFSDRMSRPEYGEMRIAPAELLAYRTRLEASEVIVLADIQVKYAHMLEPRTLQESAARAHAAGADGVVVSGSRTGEPPSLEELADARAGASEIPVLVGSGLAPGNAASLLGVADGAIVGTSLLRGGHAQRELVEELAREAGRARPPA
jgi:membrane complex biogenesis BtpA family protein